MRLALPLHSHLDSSEVTSQCKMRHFIFHSCCETSTMQFGTLHGGCTRHGGPELSCTTASGVRPFRCSNSRRHCSRGDLCVRMGLLDMWTAISPKIKQQDLVQMGPLKVTLQCDLLPHACELTQRQMRSMMIRSVHACRAEPEMLRCK